MQAFAELRKATSDMARDLEACTKANEELHSLREAAKQREALMAGKLKLEQEARRGMIRRSCFA